MFFRGVKVKATDIGFMEFLSKKAVEVNNLPEGVKLVINGTNIKEGKLGITENPQPTAVNIPTMPEGFSFDPKTGVLRNHAVPKVPKCLVLKLDDQGGISVMGKGIAPTYIPPGGEADFSRYGEFGKDYIIEWV